MITTTYRCEMFNIKQYAVFSLVIIKSSKEGRCPGMHLVGLLTLCFHPFSMNTFKKFSSIFLAPGFVTRFVQSIRGKLKSPHITIFLVALIDDISFKSKSLLL